MELSDKSVAEIARELSQIPFFDDLRAGALLQRAPFFKDVDVDTLDEIAADCILRNYPSKQAICRQGEYGDTFYLILKGKVDEPGFRVVYFGTLKELGLTNSQVDKYIARNRQTLEAAIRGDED